MDDIRICKKCKREIHNVISKDKLCIDCYLDFVEDFEKRSKENRKNIIVKHLEG